MVARCATLDQMVNEMSQRRCAGSFDASSRDMRNVALMAMIICRYSDCPGCQAQPDGQRTVSGYTPRTNTEIGRASCREREEITLGAGAVESALGWETGGVGTR